MWDGIPYINVVARKEQVIPWTKNENWLVLAVFHVFIFVNAQVLEECKIYGDFRPHIFVKNI